MFLLTKVGLSGRKVTVKGKSNGEIVRDSSHVTLGFMRKMTRQDPLMDLWFGNHQATGVYPHVSHIRKHDDGCSSRILVQKYALCTHFPVISNDNNTVESQRAKKRIAQVTLSRKAVEVLFVRPR
jgi:hypothetical protein